MAGLSDVHFGWVCVGDTAERAVVVTRTADEDVVVRDAWVVAPDLGFDLAAGEVPDRLGPGETFPLLLRFAPDRGGSGGLAVESSLEPELLPLRGVAR